MQLQTLNLPITVPERELDAFCRRWKITELALFGSVLRDDFNADSDVDLLVSFAPEADWSLLDHVQMEQDLGLMLRRPVDLITRRAVERSQNTRRRQSILASAQPIYVTR